MANREKIITAALEHIHHAQRPDGSFASFSSTRLDDFSDAIPRKTTFFTANILLCLCAAGGALAGAEAVAIKKKAAAFLLGQRSERWSFNYWARDEKERMAKPYPDDLDDTFAALAALAQYDPATIDARALAAAARLLTANEAQEGGPYKTWLVANDTAAEWRDTDIAINSTVGYFLSLVDIRLPHLERFIADSIENSCMASPYYPGQFPVAYFIARYYKNQSRAERGPQERLATIIRTWLKDKNGGITPLEHAMAISALAYLGSGTVADSAGSASLLTELDKNGFRPHAFCIDPAREGKRAYAGASSLTAAFCIEALLLSADLEKPRTHILGNVNVTSNTHDRIRSLARAACRNVGANLRAMVLEQIERTSDQKITGLAYEFQNILRIKGEAIPETIVESLALANLYGWMAYDIYDDLLDGEGDPALIPCANFFLRRLADIYDTLEKDIPGVRGMFNVIINRIDDANAWEQNHCRLPAAKSQKITSAPLPQFGHHENLANRSIGHALGPLAMILAIGHNARSGEYDSVLLFFRHYLIARQLHDDAHDWADDLLRGRVNSVGAMVIKRFRGKDLFENRAETVDIATAIPQLQKIFWEEIIDEVVSLIRSHITAARRLREQSRLIAGTGFLEVALEILASSAQKALAERDGALVFLNHYRAGPIPGETI